jgi:hypothetical protein
MLLVGRSRDQFPMLSLGFFPWHPSIPCAWVSTQHLKMSTRILLVVKTFPHTTAVVSFSRLFYRQWPTFDTSCLFRNVMPSIVFPSAFRSSWAFLPVAVSIMSYNNKLRCTGAYYFTVSITKCSTVVTITCVYLRYTKCFKFLSTLALF